MSYSFWHYVLKHVRLPCPSPTPWACSNSCPLSRWCHSTISSSVTPFSSNPQSFPASRSFPMIQLFTSGGQTIGASASSSVPSNDYSGLIPFRIDWFDLLAFQGILKSLLQHHSLNASILFFFFLNASILWHPTFFMVQFSHPYSTTGKTWLLEKKKHVTFVWLKVMTDNQTLVAYHNIILFLFQ